MIILPAIDLWQGKVVRLVKGDPKNMTVYGQDPLAVAKEWQNQGAQWLHVVDLSAAFSDGNNLSIIEQIVKEVKVNVEVGGGIRDFVYAKKLIDLGAKRIVIGTRACDQEFMKELVTQFGADAVAVGIDVINAHLAVEGWQKNTKWTVKDTLSLLSDCGVKWVIYTDISRDGTLSGVNINQFKDFSCWKNFKFIASGGVASLEDLKALANHASFVWGVIVGKALYEESFTLPEAIKVIKK